MRARRLSIEISSVLGEEIKTVKSLKKSRSLESLQTCSHARSIQSKCHYKLSTQHLAFLMEEERMKDLERISRSSALGDYYQTFNSLFLVIYKTSTLVLTYMYYNKTHELNLDRLQLLNILMCHFTDHWTPAQLQRIRHLSTNLYEMAKEEKEFQRRIEYVARKLCSNREKQNKIERAFLNEDLKKFWERMAHNIATSQRHSFVDDMFDTYPKKLCFYDIHCFLIRSLCQSHYRDTIGAYCARQEIDEDMSINYTFQFLLLEEFTFENGKQNEEEEGKCKLM